MDAQGTGAKCIGSMASASAGTIGAGIRINVSVHVRVNRIRDAVERMNLDGVRGDRFQIIDGELGIVERFGGRYENDVRAARRTPHPKYNVTAIL